MLLLRVLSALAGIPIVLGAVYLGELYYLTLILLVVNLGLFEYRSLLKARGHKMPLIPALAGGSLLVFFLFIEQVTLIYPLLMLLLFIHFLLPLFDMEKNLVQDSALSVFGIIYVAGLAGFMLLLRQLPAGAHYTYLLLAGVWIHDTAAYFIGVKWGVRKFAPEISPNKSVEGSLAGIGATILLFFSAAILWPALLPFGPGTAVIFAFGIAIFAQLGDLLESALKRQLAVKDSGNIIPGHGGILDRFDSLLVTAPFVYYFFLLI